MRKRIYTIVERAKPGDTLSRAYDIFIIVVALVSVSPLMFKEQTPLLQTVDIVTVYLLFADYILRWITADYSGKRKGVKAFLVYPFTPFAIIDLISLLPSLGVLGQGFRILRLLRIMLVFHYSKQFRYISNVIKKKGRVLLSVLFIAVFYIFISALAVFEAEPDTFQDFFEALYWATTALTTIGYGDLAPITDLGRLISMLSSLFGIAIIALPAGIVTAGFVDEMSREKNNRAKPPRSPKTLHKREAAPPMHINKNTVRYLIIIAIGIAMDFFLNLLAQRFNWPVLLDTTGTAYAALILEPAAGLLVGLVNNAIFTIEEFSAVILSGYAISAAFALIVGVYLKKGGKIESKRIIPSILMLIAISSVLADAVGLWANHGGPPSGFWQNRFYTQAMGAGAPYLFACFFGEFVVNAINTLATAGLLAVFYLATPKSVRLCGTALPQ